MTQPTARRHLTRLASAAARQLREHSRLVGAMVGALAGYRQQDAVHGLPLQLTAEEVTLAAHKGAPASPAVGGRHTARRARVTEPRSSVPQAG